MTNKTGLPTLDIYHFIVDWAMAHRGNTPSQRQIADGLDVAQSTAHYHIHILVGMGLLEQIDGELCVARGVFTMKDPMYDMTPIHRIYPDILSMTVIPEFIAHFHVGGMTAEEVGIVLGEKADDEFLYATYPEGFCYEKAEPESEFDFMDRYYLYTPAKHKIGWLDYSPATYTAMIHLGMVN